jgi:hypothetical protein
VGFGVFDFGFGLFFGFKWESIIFLGLFLVEFAFQIPFFAYRLVEDDLPALKSGSVQIFDGFKGEVSVGEFDKRKPSTAFFVRVLRDVYVKDLSEGREKFAEMIFADVKHEISYNNSVVLDFLFFLFFCCLIGRGMIEKLGLLFFVFGLFVFDVVPLLFC